MKVIAAEVVDVKCTILDRALKKSFGMKNIFVFRLFCELLVVLLLGILSWLSIVFGMF